MEQKKKSEDAPVVEVAFGNALVLERGNRLTIFGNLLYTAIFITCFITLFYPFFDGLFQGHFQCVFQTLTGHPCPTCGYTRALSAALQGNIFEAFLFNPLWMVYMLYLTVLAILSLKAIWQSKGFVLKAIWIKLFVAAILINWVVKLVIGGAYY
jgi:hypothetical protein